MKVRSFLLALLLLLSAVPPDAAAQTNGPLYVSTSWTMDQGLPQSSVNSIIQTRDRYLWLATFGGLVRFNGRSFTVFNRSNSPGMTSERTLMLWEGPDSSIWCGSEAGLLRFREGRFRSYPIMAGSRVFSPQQLKVDGRGVIWLIAHTMVLRCERDSFVVVPISIDPSLRTKALDDPSGTWLGLGSRLIRTTGDSAVLVWDFGTIIHTNIQNVEEHPVGSGIIWAATSGDGIVRWDGRSERKFLPKDGLTSEFTRSLKVDRFGVLWGFCYNGVVRWNGERFEQLRTVSGEVDAEVNTIETDVEGNVWGGTPSLGLQRFRPAIVSTIGPDDGLKETKMLSLVRRADGSYLFGTNCGGVYEWNGAAARYSRMNRLLPNLCVWSLFEDSRRNVWVGSRLLQRFDPTLERMELMDSAKGFNGLDIFAITEDQHGVVWVGCDNGLWAIANGSVRQYTERQGLTGLSVRALYPEPDGGLWIGTTTGLFHAAAGHITAVPLTAAPGAQPVTSSYVRAIRREPDGSLWLGMYGGGIVRLKEGVATAITTSQGMFDDVVSHLIDDGRGSFWSGNNRGIVRLRKQELIDVADGRRKQIVPMVFGVRDGMITAETNGGFQPSVAMGDAGEMFFPTVNGVAALRTQEVRENTVVPPVVIEEVVSAGRLRDGDVTLSYDSASIDIHFAALSFTDPDKVRYRYKLEGIDNEWTEAGNRTIAYYTHLPAGRWTFRVIASNNDALWNTTGTSLTIVVTPPFWQTWWFSGLVLLFFLIIGPSIYYFRVTQLKHAQLRQQDFAEQLIGSQEKERRRIAAELHDGVGQQILIVKNRAELALKYVGDPERMREQLREIAESAMVSINDLRSISHDLRPVHLEEFGLTETLRTLGEQLQEGSSIRWIVSVDDIDGVLPKEKEINFYRIMQEGTKNILEHSAAANASLIVRRMEESVTATLWDDGSGFDPLLPKESAGLGLRGMEERTRTFGGILEVRSRPGEGTAITVTIDMLQGGTS